MLGGNKMNFLLIAEAGAATNEAANEAANSVMGGMSWFTILWLVAIVAFFYFFMIRPQKKEQKKVSAMLAELATGDVVLTTSGFYGVIIDIQDDTVIVEFGNNKNCRIPMQKQAIVQVEKSKQA
jgi:preprotein translocase subunit YajC